MSVKVPPPLPIDSETILEPKAYAVYQGDFGAKAMQIKFEHACIIVNRKPHISNATREHTYWHIVTEGKYEATRMVAIERIVRITWIKPILVGYLKLKVWREWRGAHIHWNIWHTNNRHVVVVKELSRGDYLLVTAYRTDNDVALWHRRFIQAKKMGHALTNVP